MKAPRLLPMLGVGLAGVIAVKALAGVGAMPAMLASTAHAEPAKAAAAKPAAPAAVAAARPAAPRPVQACLPTAAILAKEAGVSPSELRVLQSLGERRGMLDEREQAIDTQGKLLGAAEMKLDAKIKALTALKADLQGLVTQASTQQKGESDRLVSVYEKMKPKDAAPIMATLDDKVRLPVAAKMKPQILAAILGQMQPQEAKKLTERLAERLSQTDAVTAKAAAALGPKPRPAA